MGADRRARRTGSAGSDMIGLWLGICQFFAAGGGAPIQGAYGWVMDGTLDFTAPNSEAWAAIMRKVGAIPALAAGKVAAGFAGWYLYAQDDMLILPILCLVYAGVVVNNVRVILQASG